MGKIKGFLFAVRHREILMTDLGLNSLIRHFELSYKTIFSGSAGPFSVVLRPCVAELVTLRFFAKRLFRVTCSVEAFDIFHQLSSTQYIINASSFAHK